MAKKHLGLDRSCVLAAFYRRLYERGSSILVVVNGNYAEAARELGLNLPHHRMRTTLENLSYSENRQHKRLIRDPDNWAEESYTLKDECLATV